ncbi:MAG TPA: DNA polymerase IV [Kiritimatiellia bacterium]|nr:DNA polymerase IV [Kiritimatiellia bacterium]
MIESPYTLYSFPRAIVHLDGDAFFAAVEQAVHPEWRGLPLVTGKERGIIACASYEAKALGIKRGVALHEARKMCRDLIVLPSDYETYCLYSKRMFNIMRRYTPVVEESSIDEGFADLTGLRRVFRTSYVEIARQMKQAIQTELDITVSLGVGLSKSIAKLASKHHKPNGLTAIAGHRIHEFLQRIPIEEVWGFGPNISAFLRKQGIITAFDFTSMSEAWAAKKLGKIGREIWGELRGNAIYPIVTEEKNDYATIGKCKTFTAPSSDREFVYAKLVRNVESAFIKVRRHRLRARLIYVALRRKDYSQRGVEADLTRPTSSPREVAPLVRVMFDRLYEAGAEYRTTMVVLGRLEEDRIDQFELFEDRVRIDQMREASRAIDDVAEDFGKHAVALGTGLHLDDHRITDRDEKPLRKNKLIAGETARQRLEFPYFNVEV